MAKKEGTCAFPKCRKTDIAVVYYDNDICEGHWAEWAAKPAAELKELLGIDDDTVRKMDRAGNAKVRRS